MDERRPTSRGCWWDTAMGGPAVTAVFLQPVEPAHVLRETYGLENAHILAAGKNVSPLDFPVDAHDRPCNVFFFVQLEPGQHRLQGRSEISIDERHVRNFRYLPDGHRLGLADFKALFQEGLAGLLVRLALKENMKRIQVPVFRVNAVSGKAAAQTVGPVVHGAHTLHDGLTGHFPAFSGNDGGDGAAGGNTDLTFFLHGIASFPKRPNEKRRTSTQGLPAPRVNERLCSFALDSIIECRNCQGGFQKKSKIDT